MKTRKITVGLLFGGRSAEHKISVDSAAAVFRHLDKRYYRTRCLYINKKGEWREVASPLLSPSDLGRGRFSPFLPWQNGGLARTFSADIYFPILHGPYGEDGTIQGLLEMAGRPYVGAGVTPSALGMDKALQKALFAARGLPVVKHRVILEKDWLRQRKAILAEVHDSLGLPLFVKPANLGSSVGITKVKSQARLAAAILTAFRYDRKILVEEGITGRELECSVLGNDHPAASLPGELIPFREFYDYEDKYLENKTKFIIPAVLPPDTVRQVRQTALAAFQAVDGNGMARVDFLLEQGSGRLYLSEINTIPGFTDISMYPRLWERSGLPFPRLLDRLIRLGFEHHAARKNCLERGRP